MITTEREAPIPRRRFLSYGTLAVLVGMFLIAAAVLKGYQLAYFSLREDDLVSSRALYVLFVSCEFLFGSWLITGLYRQATRIVALLGFYGLLNVSLWQALEGKESCGCLGAIKTNPWFAVIVDSMILFGLLAMTPERHGQPAGIRLRKLLGFALVTLCVGIPAVLTMTVYRRHTGPFSDLRHDPTVHRAYVDIYLDSPKSRPDDMLRSVATATEMTMDVDDGLQDSFSICEPDWKKATYRGVNRSLAPAIRGWAVLETMSKSMPIPCRWVKTNSGYTLVDDNPLKRTRYLWAICLLCGTGVYYCGVWRRIDTG